MNIKKAYELTGTKNPNQLAKFLGLSHTACYKWERMERLPKTAEFTVREVTNTWPSSKAS